MYLILYEELQFRLFLLERKRIRNQLILEQTDVKVEYFKVWYLYEHNLFHAYNTIHSSFDGNKSLQQFKKTFQYRQ